LSAVAARLVAVLGATGRQGGAVARRLLGRGWRVRALTRRPGGLEARALAALGAEVHEADLDSPASLEAAFHDAHGAYLVTDFWEHGLAAEVRHGANAIDAATRAGIRHLVFSSVGGTDRTEGLGITHFDGKRRIERHLARSGLLFTIFRPVTFLENFVSPRYRSAIAQRGVFDFCIDPAKPFQMVAMQDVGVFVEMAFADPNAFQGRALELASDRCTMTEFAAALEEHLRRPVRYRLVGPAMQRLLAFAFVATGSVGRYKAGPSLIAQFRWNNASATGGWDAAIDQLRRLHPGLMTIREWIRSVDWRQGLGAPASSI
jgi:uncharacterized protein YbjT (DUF2867 family)